ncbi:monocarboxylate transporter 12-like [Harmonia axyridis]|uniref:monocarboxylate transporter 12-like n=1 Tax=Harmonia axyridis TaxID=115357 RepID=UPI001E27807C|nr:monocarboxylate transporter 12-like [Harmonia axyridis]XP_045478237.1 monocarboxylate transporter 12-like [Harmonia axyridis]XP_045478238.1 monocarboxylate transporter 12-like [Harmonia axyridis]
MAENDMDHNENIDINATVSEKRDVADAPNGNSVADKNDLVAGVYTNGTPRTIYENPLVGQDTPAEEEKPILRVQFNEDDRQEDNQDVKQTLLRSRESISSSSGSSSDSESSDEYTEARPPDGGWGWVIVAASFMVNLIADGITFSFGVIFVEFVDYFHADRGTTAVVGGLFMAMPLLSGPIASFLTDRYGCRKVTIFGSILSSVAFMISSRMNSMMMLYLTFGLMAGFGLSLCYVASVVIVAYYFEKRRSFATGLAVCGSGIGTFIFAPLIQFLLDEYGWRGTTLILAGLFLNLAVCGLLMRDLPWTFKQQKKLAKERKRNRELKRRNKGSSVDTFSVSNSTNTASALQPILEATEAETSDNAENRLCSSLVNLPTYVDNREKVPIEVIELLASHKNVYNVIKQNYPGLLSPSRSFSDSARLNNEIYTTMKTIGNAPPDTTNIKDELFLKWNEKANAPPKKAPKTAFLNDLRIHRLSVSYRGAMLNINRYRLRASSCPDIYRNSMTTLSKEKNQWFSALWDLWDLLVDIIDISHLADPKFLVFALSNFLLYTWYDVPYVYMTDYATNNLKVTSENASLLISMIGIVNMVGEIILGWMGDRPWANAELIYAFCMFCCGGVTALMPFATNYTVLSALSGAFGFFIAANYSLVSIILVELISIDRFANAYGLLLLVQGFGNLIGPSLGGYICDVTKSYTITFVAAGVCIAISGAFLLILPILKRYRKFVSRQVSNVSLDVESCRNSKTDPIEAFDATKNGNGHKKH